MDDELDTTTDTLETGTSYFGVRDPTHVEADLDRFVDSGLTSVLHTFSEADLEYYRETMSEIVAASHERGLTVYMNPWGVGRVFGGEAFSEFIGRNPEDCQVMSTGERLPAACFNAPGFRSYMRDWTEAGASVGADVLFWDEPHWYIPEWHDEQDCYPDEAWSCRCEHCQERFFEQYGEPMDAAHTDRVEQFREQSLLSFLVEMMQVGSAAGCSNAVCLLPSEDSKHGLRNWDELAKRPELDVLATDPYWTLHGDGSVGEFVSYFSEMVASLARTHDCDSQIWIQGFRLPAGGETTDAVRTATQAAVDSDVDSVFMWGYDACRTISSIASEEPDAVWNTYLETLP